MFQLCSALLSTHTEQFLVTEIKLKDIWVINSVNKNRVHVGLTAGNEYM